MKELENAYKAFLSPSSKKVFHFFEESTFILGDFFTDASLYGFSCVFGLISLVIAILFLPTPFILAIILTLFALDYSYTNMSFGGFLNTKTKQNDYVRTSTNMKKMFLKLTYYNGYRRILNYLFMFFLFYWLTYKSINILAILALVVFTFAVGEFVAFFGYYITNSFMFTPVALIGLIVSGGFLFLFVANIISVLFMIIGIVLGIIGVLIKYFLLKRKVGQIYYGI